MPITAPAPALTKERPPGPRSALPSRLADADAAGLGEDGMVALFTSALPDIHKRRGGQPDRAGAASDETEGSA
jgi:hypothetical protein